MDIQKWLNEAAPSVQRSHDDNNDARRHKQQLSKDTVRSALKRTERLRRRKDSSDSSIIRVAARTTQPRFQRDAKALQDDSDAESSARSSSPSSSEDEQSDHSSDPYRRRPRRKTRGDKYEPGAKEKKAAERRKVAKENREERRSKVKKCRKRKKKLGTGMVHKFRAKNVPKERLTLRALDNVGFFKKAKASSPIRGRGLPDLVFSEMRFLQKRKAPPGDDNAKQRDEAPSKKQKQKEKLRGGENEMSAYFSATQAPIRERPASPQPGLTGVPMIVSDNVTSGRRSSSVRPTIELLGNPFLGFGGRGPMPESSSRLSWSESARPLSNAPEEPQSTSAISVGHLNDRQTHVPAGAHTPLQRTTFNDHPDDSVLRQRSFLPRRRGTEDESRVAAPSRPARLRSANMTETAAPPSTCAQMNDQGVRESCENSGLGAVNRRSSAPAAAMSSRGRLQQYKEWLERSDLAARDSMDGNGNSAQSSSLGELLNDCRHAVDPETREVMRPGLTAVQAQPQRVEQQLLTGDGQLPMMYRTISNTATTQTVVTPHGWHQEQHPLHHHHHHHHHHAPAATIQNGAFEDTGQLPSLDDSIVPCVAPYDDGVLPRERNSFEHADPSVDYQDLSTYNLAYAAPSDEQGGTEPRSSDGELQGFWRPHRLY